MTKEEVLQFKKYFRYLYQGALNHLITKEWAEQIDRDVRISVPMISENEVTFELIHTMITKILATKTMTWEEINELISTT